MPEPRQRQYLSLLALRLGQNGPRLRSRLHFHKGQPEPAVAARPLTVLAGWFDRLQP